MRSILVTICLLGCQALLALHQPVSIKDSWFISRVVMKQDYFDYTQNYFNGQPENALAIEPYYMLQIRGPLGMTISSAIKKIKRIGTDFLIYTLHGTIYKAPLDKLFITDNFNKFYDAYKKMPNNIYRRRNLYNIKEDIRNKKIFPLQNYKTWTKYIPEISDREIFTLSEKLKNMKSRESIYYDFTEDDLTTIMMFR